MLRIPRLFSTFVNTDSVHIARKLSPAFAIRTITDKKQDELYKSVTVEVKAHDKAVLDSFQKFVTMTSTELDLPLSRIVEPPHVKTRMSLMKSVFVHKKHFHQYEMRTLYRVFEFKHITGSTADTFLEYIQRNLPEGMAMKVTKCQLEKIPTHIRPPSSVTPSESSAAS